jgi:hypothetical protein
MRSKSASPLIRSVRDRWGVYLQAPAALVPEKNVFALDYIGYLFGGGVSGKKCMTNIFEYSEYKNFPSIILYSLTLLKTNSCTFVKYTHIHI